MARWWLVGLLVLFTRLAYGQTVQWVKAPVLERRNGYDISVEALSRIDRAEYGVLFEEEWARYPKSFFATIGLKRVVIGANLTVFGETRSAFADLDTQTLWLDARSGRKIPVYGRHVLHHDLFHLVDAGDPKISQLRTAWATLNRPNFTYGDGGWFMRDSNAGNLRSDLPGFLTEYATSALDEDRAEVFGHLISHPTYVSRQILTDRILAAKVKAIKAQIARLEPKMNATWWPKD